jgi:hypothetical protein
LAKETKMGKTDKRTSIPKRLDLNPELVRRAKVAHKRRESGADPKDLEKVQFREVMDHAIEKFLPEIVAALDKIGLTKSKVQNRQRPVSIKTWDRLDSVVEKYDISKVQLVRCALEMLARSAEGASASDEGNVKRKTGPSAPNGGDGGA